MTLSESILGKKLTDLTFSDLENYFKSPRQESNIIEYKSYNPNGNLEQKFPGIFKAICALLNSEGGILVWGSPEGKKVQGRREKEFHGSLTPITDLIEKDYLISKISDSIIPLPQSIMAEIISKDHEKIVVFEIGKSDYAPHQTDNTYYMRLDGQSRPAPHHYIDAMFKRIKFPEIGGYLKFEGHKHDGRELLLYVRIFILNHSPLLNEENISMILTSDQGTFENIYPIGAVEFDLDNHQLIQNNFSNILSYGDGPCTDAVVRYNLKTLAKSDYNAELVLMFGGKKSPKKYSTYYMDFKEIDKHNTNELVSFDENRLASDIGLDNLSEKERVNKILGR